MIFIVLCVFVVAAGVTLALIDKLLMDHERPVDDDTDDFPDDYWDGPFDGHWNPDDAPEGGVWKSIYGPK